MLTYQNGRFYCGYASFAIPDNCKIDGINQYAGSHNGLMIYAPDGSYSMDISYDAYDCCARDHLIHMAEEQESVYDPIPFTFAGLQGWELNEDRPDGIGRTIVFDVNGGYDPCEEGKINVLEIIVWSEKGLPWDTIRTSASFCNLLGGLQC